MGEYPPTIAVTVIGVSNTSFTDPSVISRATQTCPLKGLADTIDFFAFKHDWHGVFECLGTVQHTLTQRSPTGKFESSYELLSKVGDGGFQAARSISFSPSLNLTPSTISARR